MCITIISSLLCLKELNKEEDMICFTLDKQDDGNVTLTAYYPYYNLLLGTVFRVFSLYSSIFILRNIYPFLFYTPILSTTIILSTQPLINTPVYPTIKFSLSVTPKTQKIREPGFTSKSSENPLFQA